MIKGLAETLSEMAVDERTRARHREMYVGYESSARHDMATFRGRAEAFDEAAALVRGRARPAEASWAPQPPRTADGLPQGECPACAEVVMVDDDGRCCDCGEGVRDGY